MKWIDSHVHIWTPDLERYPLAEGVDPASLEPPDFSPEVILRHARPSQVERIVLVGTGFYQTRNQYMLDSVERFPDILRAVAIVDHQSEGVADDMRGLLSGGVTGFRIVVSPGEGEGWLQHPGFGTMFRTCAETGQAMCALVHADGLADLDRMCGEHPDTVVVVDHMARIGETYPASDENLDALCALVRHPKVHVKISRFHALGEAEPPHDDLAPQIRRVYDAFGPERMMWGSDSPFQVTKESYEDSISLVRDRLDFLTDSDREHMLVKTAERVFFFR
jgi:predicted TIM-barrel fold metal-dependent hydrolase